MGETNKDSGKVRYQSTRDNEGETHFTERRYNERKRLEGEVGETEVLLCRKARPSKRMKKKEDY